MATTGTGKGSSGMGATTTGGQQLGGETSDRRPAGDTGSSASSSTGGGTGTGAITQTLKDTTYRSIDDQKARASETLGSLAGAVRGMTQPLRDGGQPQIADYVNKAADGIERWASQMRQKDLEDAVRAVEQFARRQPAMFLGIAFGAGLIAARFLKSSSSDRDRDRGMRYYGDDFDTSAGGGPTSLGSTGLGSTGMGSSGMGSGGVGGANYGTGSTGTTSGDIPRVSGDLRNAGEVL